MSAHTSIQENLHGSSSNISTDNHRQRGISFSEHQNLQVSENGTPTPIKLPHEKNLNSIQVAGKPKFNRSLTEVRPDAYIFDDGHHFEVRPVQEEEEVVDRTDILREVTLFSFISPNIFSNHSNNPQLPIPKVRKHSMLSEDSDMFCHEKHLHMSDTIRKPPFLNIIRQETDSTESRDTLTPLEASDDQTLVEDGSAENITDLNFEAAKRNALRRRSTARRNSESCSNYNDIQRSQTSLHAAGAMSRRQVSLTQSEPDSGNEQGMWEWI